MRPQHALFLVSFISLFLELLLIRWVPSQVRVIAYYGNLMLLSSFLGLGCGAMLARRELRLSRFFAPLMCAFVIAIAALQGVRFHQGPDEFRFLFAAGTNSTTLPIVLIFALNASLFLPLGELIGTYFSRIAAVQAYSWDLGGAIAGTALFGLFSYAWFSPVVGFAVAMVGFMFVCAGRRQMLWNALLFTITLLALTVGLESDGFWSPYNLIAIREVKPDGTLKPAAAPRQDIGTMRDPPFYMVQVNGDFYMMNGTIDLRRYTHPGVMAASHDQYMLPHRFRPAAKDVLVVGSGGGVDVEAALLSGAERVDALEIDPVIIQLGRRFNPSRAYQDPRVTVVNTDARPFFRRTRKTYDMVVFGFLDSQSLFSQMSSIRLDGYVYTRESFREAFELVRAGGLMSVSFFAGGHLWLLDRLVAMVRSATGAAPLIFTKPTGQVIILAAKGFSPAATGDIKSYRRIQRTPPRATDEALDDWPYLYLRSRSIPVDYLFTIGSLLLISALFIAATFDKQRRGLELHFFFLGAGFLLLETKSITTLSLFYGATWLVSMLVILGVLIMVLPANLVAARIERFHRWLYLPLLASVVFLYVFPNALVLGWAPSARFLYSILLMPLPIFFAGLIFSASLKASAEPGFAFGSNLLGAMVGGFVEYLGMIAGSKALLLLVLALYLASLLAQSRARGGCEPAL